MKLIDLVQLLEDARHARLIIYMHGIRMYDGGADHCPYMLLIKSIKSINPCADGEQCALEIEVKEEMNNG